LWYALVENVNPEITKVLAYQGASINTVDSFGRTPLIYAAAHVYPEVIPALIGGGFDVNAVDLEGKTALIHAIEHYDAPETEKIVEVYDARAFTRYELTQSRPETIMALIESGADVNIASEDGETPLMLALESNVEEEIIELLIRLGADVNAEDRYGTTPLISAVRANVPPMIIQRLIEAGARTDARYLGGSTPLMIAAAFCNPEVVDILIEVGSNINTRDEVYGRTALMYAVEFNSNAEITKLLIDSGADVNVRDEEGITPLILAAMEGENPDVIKMLLDAGADGRIKDAEGWTAYDYARRNDVIEGTEAYWLLNDARF